VTAHLPLGFDHTRYVPVVLTRQGEMLALRLLDPTVKEATTPLFVVHPVPLDVDTGLPSCTPQRHVERLVKPVTKGWGVRPAFVDLQHIDTTALMPDGSHPLLWLVRECAEQGLPLAPVLSAGRDLAYRKAAVTAARACGSSLCLRLPSTEWADLGKPLGDGRLLTLLAETGLEPEQVHVVLDCAQVGDAALAARAVEGALAGLPRAHQWASLTVAGTGLPVGTSDVGPDNHKYLPRTEWLLWRRLDGSGYRRPAFGDYCVQHPDPQTGYNPKTMDTSAQLRYTTAEAWLVTRGRGLKKNGREQIRDLARQVVEHSDYSGAGFSWGDQWLTDVAAGACGAGTQLVWRKATTTHHLTYVVRQLATLLGT